VGELLARLKREFAAVRHVKPKASRADSAELYLLANAVVSVLVKGVLWPIFGGRGGGRWRG
jgi:23S rRNA (uridine2552-2'-O)-methyltransferase